MLEAARNRGFEAAGVEISPAASAARGRGFTVYDRPLEEVNLPGSTFDVITAIDVIEHLSDIKKFMAESFRILKPGGVLLIVTPDVGSSAAKIMKRAWPHYKEEHIFYFSKRSLEVLLQRSGFAVRTIRCGRKYITFDYAVRLLRKYTPGTLTSLVASVGNTLPSILRSTAFCLPTEMMAIAQRQVSSQEVRPTGHTCMTGTDNLISQNVYGQM
jgi:SAM-dependent methyltransferase